MYFHAGRYIGVRNAGCRDANTWEWKDAVRQLVLCISLIIKSGLWCRLSQASGKGLFNAKENVETWECPLKYTAQTINGMWRVVVGSDCFPRRLKRRDPGDLRLNLKRLLWFADLYLTSPQGKRNQLNWSHSSIELFMYFSILLFY